MTEIELKNFEVFLQARFNNPFLQLDCRPEWSSLSENHREHIRARVNQSNVQSSSVSHCQNMGGYVASNKAVRLGLDMEENNRITIEVLQRMFSKDEIDTCPEPSALWCAKEALYKALKEDGQPQVLSELPPLQWQRVSEQPNIVQATVDTSTKNLSEKIFSSLVGYCLVGSANSVCVFSDSI